MSTHTNFVRDTPGSGLVGSWKYTDKTEGLVMHWLPAGPNGLHMETPELHSIVDLSFDGKECHPAGPTGSYMSMSATRTGANSFTLVQRMMVTATPPTEYRVSADGNTLTATSHEINDTPKDLTYVRVQ
ncbi:MAG: hypothetical protein M3Y50_00670 [Acidobacteriota bacterium]|nr:hypothetical protein [Acidobacteriota bacterium]